MLVRRALGLVLLAGCGPTVENPAVEAEQRDGVWVFRYARVQDGEALELRLGGGGWSLREGLLTAWCSMRVSDAELRELFERNADRTDVGEYGAGVSDEWCARAEEAIGLTLPPSYRWWLQKYGRGSILGDEIFGIHEKDFDKVLGGDVVYVTAR